LAPVAAQAQPIPAAVVAVVDLERVTGECNACKTAAASLRAQVASLQSREKALAAPLQTEKASIQTAINALNGAAPDAALQARIQAFQAKQQSGADELSRQQDQLQANQRYVQKQVSDKMGPIYQSVMKNRGATLLVEMGSTLAAAQSLDVTSDVLTGLNASLTSLSVNAPAAPAAPKNQGR
jgi:Skp family chaperone for outer membrane proteins